MRARAADSRIQSDERAPCYSAPSALAARGGEWQTWDIVGRRRLRHFNSKRPITNPAEASRRVAARESPPLRTLSAPSLPDRVRSFAAPADLLLLVVEGAVSARASRPSPRERTPDPTVRLGWRARLADPMATAVLALGITQITAWGTSYYCLGVLAGPITRTPAGAGASCSSASPSPCSSWASCRARWAAPSTGAAGAR